MRPNAICQRANTARPPARLRFILISLLLVLVLRFEWWDSFRLARLTYFPLGDGNVCGVGVSRGELLLYLNRVGREPASTAQIRRFVLISYWPVEWGKDYVDTHTITQKGVDGQNSRLRAVWRAPGVSLLGGDTNGLHATNLIIHFVLLELTACVPLMLTVWGYVRAKKRHTRWLNMRCVDCGYDLRWSGPRCPECGAEGDPKPCGRETGTQLVFRKSSI